MSYARATVISSAAFALMKDKVLSSFPKSYFFRLSTWGSYKVYKLDRRATLFVRNIGCIFDEIARCFYEEFYQVSAKYKDTFPSKLMKTFKEAARDILKEIVPEHLDHIVFGKFKFYGNEAIGRVMDQIQSKLFAEKLVMILRI
jgi:hypothetical protein